MSPLSAIRELTLKAAREYVALQGETRQMTIEGAKMAVLAKADAAENKNAIEIGDRHE